MADPSINDIDETVAPPLGGADSFDLNKRLDCEHLGEK